MALTFRSTVERLVAMTEWTEDGRDRTVVARLDPNVTGVTRWNLELEHPSGKTFPGTYTGPAVGLGSAMSAMLAETQQQYREEGKRGDRQPTQLDPMRGYAGLPGGGVVSMPGGPPLKMRTK